MPATAKATIATVIPALRYRDAPAAIDFLCTAFGFERHFVVPGEAGTIDHAQLRFGNGMVMLGSARDDAFSRIINQSTYIIVDDADAHYETARAAGAEILKEIMSPEYGGRLYTSRDPEGNLWSFGTYDPWAAHYD
jgi:uncharacterized glyoxalase superfamily protein PhnB